MEVNKQTEAEPRLEPSNRRLRSRSAQTSMKREMLMMASSVSLNTSLQVRAPSSLSDGSLDRKVVTSATVQLVAAS